MDQELFESLLIDGVTTTGQEIGRGAYATVVQVNWRGLLCAGKKVHRVLLEDVGDGRVNRVVEGFVQECRTWSTLRHPHVAQFLGLFFESGCEIPMIVMEKMDISLRGLLEARSRQHFPLRHKVNLLHQVALGVLYLHSHKSHLVHRDLTANNILVDLKSMVAKITDFGVSRCMDRTRVGQTLTEVPGVIAYMPPEAFERPPRYSSELDVFSYGVLVIHTTVHEWPNPVHATKCEGGQLRALTELQRREVHILNFSKDERELFLPIVMGCLENNPNRRPQMSNIVAHFESLKTQLGGLSTPFLLDVEDDWLRMAEQLRTASERIVELEKLCENAGLTVPVVATLSAQQPLQDLTGNKSKAGRKRSPEVYVRDVPPSVKDDQNRIIKKAVKKKE